MKFKVSQLRNIKDSIKFADAINEIVTQDILNGSGNEVDKIYEFNSLLECLMNDIYKDYSNNRIEGSNYIIYGDEFSLIYIVTIVTKFVIDIVDLERKTYDEVNVSFGKKVDNKSKTAYFNKKLKESFRILLNKELKKISVTQDEIVVDNFKNIKEIQNFLENDVILKILQKIDGVDIVYNNFYEYPCKVNSFPMINMLYVTGVTTSESKEESLLTAIGSIVYNTITEFQSYNLNKFGFSFAGSSNECSMFSKIFSFYIMKELNKADIHSYSNQIVLFDISKFMNDLAIIEKIVDSESILPNNQIM